MAVDELVGGITGERVSSRIKRGFETEKKKEIERRLKRGDRAIPMELQF